MSKNNNIITIVGWAFILFSLWQGILVVMAGLPKQTANAGQITPVAAKDTRQPIKEIKPVNFK
jgi:hypothetical protein